MRTRSVHILFAAWLATQHSHHHVRAAPNALAAAPSPDIFGPGSLYNYARQMDTDHDAGLNEDGDEHEHEHEHGHEHNGHGEHAHDDMDMDMGMDSNMTQSPPSLFAGHDHHVHGAPLLELNETLISMYHKPTPPSYGTFDLDGDRPEGTRAHPGLMGFHALCMSAAFFLALPIGMCFPNECCLRIQSNDSQVSSIISNNSHTQASLFVRSITPCMASRCSSSTRSLCLALAEVRFTGSSRQICTLHMFLAHSTLIRLRLSHASASGDGTPLIRSSVRVAIQPSSRFTICMIGMRGGWDEMMNAVEGGVAPGKIAFLTFCI